MISKSTVVTILTVAAALTPAHGDIVHQAGLEWAWHYQLPYSITREIAGRTLRQEGYVIGGRFSVSFSTRLVSDSTLAFGRFGFEPGFVVASDFAYVMSVVLLEGGANSWDSWAWGLFQGENDDGWPTHNGIGYLGFRFANQASPDSWNYGWIRIESEPAAVWGYRITEYAYETTPDTAIIAGAIPTPGTALLIALGGLAAARRRR